MRNGGRPGNEFVQAEQERIERRRRHQDPEPRQPLSELRVVRQADMYAPNKREWHSFLDDLGSRNYDEGVAKAYGSIAVVHVSAQDMGNMLRDRYPQAYEVPGREIVLQRSVAAGLQHFMRDRQADAYHAVTRNMEVAHSALVAAVRVQFSNELIDEEMDSLDDNYVAPLPGQAYQEVTEQFQEQVMPIADEPLPFSDGTFAVGGLRLFGRGYGLDLTGNEELYTEHQDVLQYLRAGEGLDTRPLEEADWEAHGTVFKRVAHPHNRGLQYEVEYTEQPPATIELAAPKPIISKIS